LELQKSLKLVVLETPYAGDIERNLHYARACMRDCIMRGESPLASHLLYTQPGILDDEIPEERDLGIACGFAWNIHADYVVMYTDHGVSSGMKLGKERALRAGQTVVERKLYADL